MDRTIIYLDMYMNENEPSFGPLCILPARCTLLLCLGYMAKTQHTMEAKFNFRK